MRVRELARLLNKAIADGRGDQDVLVYLHHDDFDYAIHAALNRYDWTPAGVVDKFGSLILNVEATS